MLAYAVFFYLEGESECVGMRGEDGCEGHRGKVIGKIPLDIIRMNNNTWRKKVLVNGEDETYVMYKKGKIHIYVMTEKEKSNYI